MKTMKPRHLLCPILPLTMLATLAPAPLAAAEGAASAAQVAVNATNATAPLKKPDVVYVPTPRAVVNKMLELAEVRKGDVVYDLGCGDGRILVTAAKKYGVKAVGFDIDPQRVKEALENVRTNKVEHLVTIRQADIFEQDLTPASVVTLYLLPELNVRLMPQLEKLKPGSRVVSHDFDMRGAKPVKVVQVKTPANGADADSEGNDDNEYGRTEHTVYKWVVPWEKESADN
jgi:SAM-dependent methyltransferase